MNREEIIRMARESGIPVAIVAGNPSAAQIERFAQLVSAAEREACAKECEHTAVRMGSEWMAHHCAQAIRARGQQ